MNTPKAWEIAAAGFDGNHDETDHLIYWIKGGTFEEIRNLCDGVGAQFQILDMNPEDEAWAGDLDGVMPADQRHLRRILSLHHEVHLLHGGEGAVKEVSREDGVRIDVHMLIYEEGRCLVNDHARYSVRMPTGADNTRKVALNELGLYGYRRRAAEIETKQRLLKADLAADKET